MDKDQGTTPIMAMYWRQLHDIVRQINSLVLEHGDPHTISITAHFRDYAVSHDVRIFQSEEED